jgi:CheY-like chemotaxis protein
MAASIEFAQHVRDALKNLYAPVQLEMHPLLRLLGAAAGPSETRGQRLRELLIEAIERLRPDESVPFGDSSWFGYRVMRARYIEACHPAEVCNELGMSQTTFYRYHHDALCAITNILWDGWAAAPESEPHSGVSAEMGAPAIEQEAIRVARSSVRQRLDLVELLHDVVGMIKPLLAQAGISLHLDVPSLLPSTYANPAMMRQILVNVLSEAADLASGGSLTLAIHLDERGTIWCVYPVDVSQLDEIIGTGRQGLAVSHGLLQVYGGHLWRHIDDQGPGRIVFSLPTLNPPNILIIDDNQELVGLYQRYLSERDYLVYTAADRPTIRKCLAEMRPDVIMLDVLMPNEDGWSILRHFKSLPETKDVPIVICSVLDQPRLALALGADAVLQKPVLQERLLEMVGMLLEREGRSAPGY